MACWRGLTLLNGCAKKGQKPSERYSPENFTKPISQQWQLPEDALKENTLSDTKELLQQPILTTIHVSKKRQKWNQGKEDVVRDSQCFEFSRIRMVLLDNRQNSEQFCALFQIFSSKPVCAVQSIMLSLYFQDVIRS